MSEINKVISDFKELKKEQRQVFFKELMTNGDIDFLSLTIGYINMLENKRSQNNRELHGIFTLAEMNAQPLCRLKKNKLGQEFIAVLLRSKRWKSAPIEDEWKLALKDVELDENRMEMWGYSDKEEDK